jgi:rubredoxin
MWLGQALPGNPRKMRRPPTTFTERPDYPATPSCLAPRGTRRRPAVSSRVVCDASALVALLLDAGDDGQWVTSALDEAELAAPSLVGFETANIVAGTSRSAWA